MLMAMLMAATAAAAPTHDMVVEHRGGSYRVSYRPVMTTRMKTIGTAPPTRISSERCRWSAEVRVERSIQRLGEADGPAKLLSGARELQGTRPGNCIQARAAVSAEIAASSATIRSHLAAVAAADRAEALADIDAAHALTMR